MNKRNWMRLTAVLLAFGLLVAACSGDSSDDATEAATGLAEVCPNPLVVQTDWFPESEHGALYELIGEGYEIDKDNGVIRGPMVMGGTNLGIDWEVRAGGPFLGNASVSEHMALDESIHLGYGSTDQQVNHWDVTQLVSVVAPLEKNPQMVMWDPDTYPDLTGIHEIGERGIIVQVFGGGTFPDVFIAQGIWDEDKVDKSYQGSPARFITDGNIAQQGFASAEPYQYEFVHTDYGKPVAFELLHDAGFQIYSQTIGVRNGQIEELRGCLEKLVPIIQQASVNFNASAERANAIIVDTVTTYDTWWTYSPELAAFSVQAQRDFGLVGDGADNTAGNMEGSRFEKTLNDMRDAGMPGIDPDLTAGPAVHQRVHRRQHQLRLLASGALVRDTAARGRRPGRRPLRRARRAGPRESRVSCVSYTPTTRTEIR